MGRHPTHRPNPKARVSAEIPRFLPAIDSAAANAEIRGNGNGNGNRGAGGKRRAEIEAFEAQGEPVPGIEAIDAAAYQEGNRRLDQFLEGASGG